MSQPLITTGPLAALREKATHKQIIRALLSLASAALLVRIMGMFYQVVVTGRFGGGAEMDSYFVAYAVPYLLAQLITGAIEYSVIPTYARVRSQESKERANVLFSTLLNLILLGMVLLIGALFIFRSQMVFLSAPTLDTGRMSLAIGLTPFMFPILLLMVAVGFLESILNAEGQFGWPAYAGVLVPLTTGIFVFVAGKTSGVVTLTIGMIAGLILQLAIFVIRVRQAKLAYRPVLDLRMPEIGMIAIAAGPALLGGVITHASPVVDQMFASFLSAGSISALNYALKIISVFTGVLFGSIGRALFPHLSRQSAANDIKGFKKTLRLYLWVITIGTALLSLFVLSFAHIIVQILFQRGAFSADDTTRTANTLIGFAIGLVPMGLGFILSRALGALRKNHLLLYVTGFSVIANAVLTTFLLASGKRSASLWQLQPYTFAR